MAYLWLVSACLVTFSGRLSADWRILREDPEKGQEVPSFVTRLGGKKGSATLFTESLAHGTLPWRGEHRENNKQLSSQCDYTVQADRVLVDAERRTAFFKFNPHSVGWGARWPVLAHFEEELSRSVFNGRILISC